MSDLRGALQINIEDIFSANNKHKELSMETSRENKKFEIGPEIVKHLNATRKWSRFLAVLGFIVLGLLTILGLITGTFLSVFSTGQSGLGIPESIMIMLFAVAVILFFFPGLFLYKFSKYTDQAVKTSEKRFFLKAFMYMRLYFMSIGILIITCLVAYLVTLIVSGSSVTFLK